MIKKIWCILFHGKNKKWMQGVLTFNGDEDVGYPVIDIIVEICEICGTVSWRSEKVADIIRDKDVWRVPDEAFKERD
jgi:hypothetical protein